MNGVGPGSGGEDRKSRSLDVEAYKHSMWLAALDYQCGELNNPSPVHNFHIIWEIVYR